MLKRFAIFLLALALALGAPAQGAEAAAVNPSQSTMVSMAAPCSHHAMHRDAPCNGMSRACDQEMGCAVSAAVITAPAALPAPAAWRPVIYPLKTLSLAGRAIEPELFPPIIPA